MSSPWERGFRKVVALTELSSGVPQLFRTGGATILLVRTRFGLRAADATALKVELESETSWAGLLTTRSLPVEVHEGAAWVCVDPCGGDE